LADYPSYISLSEAKRDSTGPLDSPIKKEHPLSMLCDAITGDTHDSHSMGNAERTYYPKKRHHQPANAAGIEIRGKSDA
jgi:hypothetical protein